MPTIKKPTIARYGLIVPTQDGLVIPSGTTAQRSPSAPIASLRRNSSLNRLELYSGGSWIQMKNEFRHNASVSGTITASINSLYPVNTTTGTAVLNLPAGGVPGDRVGFYDPTGSWDTSSLTVNAAAGQTINGQAAETFNIENDYVVLVWSGISSSGWIRESGRFPSTVPIYQAISLKADTTRVSSLHFEQTGNTVVAGVGATVTIAAMPDVLVAMTALAVFTDALGHTQVFKVTIAKRSNFDYVIGCDSELSTGSDAVITFNVVRESGLTLLKANNTTRAGDWKTKILYAI